MLSNTMNLTGVAGALAMPAYIVTAAGRRERQVKSALQTIADRQVITGSPVCGWTAVDVPTSEPVRPGGAPG